MALWFLGGVAVLIAAIALWDAFWERHRPTNEGDELRWATGVAGPSYVGSRLFFTVAGLGLGLGLLYGLVRFVKWAWEG